MIVDSFLDEEKEFNQIWLLDARQNFGMEYLLVIGGCSIRCGLESVSHSMRHIQAPLLCLCRDYIFQF